MNNFHLAVILIAIALSSCNNSPKVLESNEGSSGQTKSSTGIFSDKGTADSGLSSSDSFKDQVHTVTVEEVLPTDRYIYLRVTENDNEEYWVATRKQEVEVGKSYYFRGGLLKTQFESKEYNRVFDRVYLVSKVVAVDHSSSPEATTTEEAEPELEMSTNDIDLAEGSISIEELVNNRSEYQGKTVQLTGKVVKVNPNIMSRNWIHLKDGSMDSYDLVITSSVAIPEGHVVSLKGTVKLDQNFGAGYTYELLVENAEIVR